MLKKETFGFTPEDYRTTLSEIQRGVSWQYSSIKPKNEATKAIWDELEVEYQEQQDQLG